MMIEVGTSIHSQLEELFKKCDQEIRALETDAEFEFKEQIVNNYRWAKMKLDQKARSWKSGGIPGGRRETKALEMVGCRFWSPKQYQVVLKYKKLIKDQIGVKAW